MVKSFKKTIACLLAVLMVAFSVPFTALASYASDFDPADPTTYHPDLEVQFGSFYALEDGTFTFDEDNVDGTNDYSYSGLYGAPVIATTSKDTTTGALKVTKLEQKASLSGDAAAQASTYNEDDPTMTTADYEYGTGDYVTLTMRLDNVTAASFICYALGWSDNIEPAGIWNAGTKKKPNWQATTISEYTGSLGWAAGGDEPMSGQGADMYGMEYFGDEAYINSTSCMMEYTAPYYVSGQDKESSDADFTFIDPVTGAGDYAYHDTFVVATLVFKITGQFDADHPIVLTPYDPTNTVWEAYQGGSYTCQDAMQMYFASYAPLDIAGGDQQFTMFGMNINSGEGCNDTPVEPTYYTVTYLDKDGGTISTEQVEEGNAPASVPALPAASGHATYAWDGDTTAAINAATTFQVIETIGDHTYGAWTSDGADTHSRTCSVCGDVQTEAHAWVAGATTPSSCTVQGSQAYTCSVCGETKSESLPLAAHTLTPHEAVAATCATAGNIAYWTCDVCGKYFADAAAETETTAEAVVIPATGEHTFGAWAPYDADQHSRTCTVCNEETEYEAHTPAAPVEEEGYSVVYCSVCGYEISRTAIADSTFTFASYAIDTDAETATVTFTGDTTGNTYTDTAALDVDTAAADCTTAGQRTYTASYDGQYGTAPAATEANGGLVIVPLAALGHNMIFHEAVPADCGNDGTIAYYECSTCSKLFADEDGNTEISDIVDPATGAHTYGAWTSVDSANHQRICSVCGDIETAPHAMSDWTVTKAATITAEGVQTRACADCDYEETETIEKLDLAVTVKADAKGGTVDFDGETVATSDVTKNYKFGDSYTLVATANEGYTFQGWTINGKSVSTSDTYSAKAFNNVTVEPIFAQNADKFTVVFYDLYKNVVSEQTVASAEELEVPTAAKMARNGYTFTGWDIDPATVTGAAAITGQYDVSEALGYTVKVACAEGVAASDYTLNGEAMTVQNIDGKDYAVYEGVKYDTKVTVAAAGDITGWKIGDTVVSTNKSYTFYVGSDVTLTAMYDAVEVVPAIDIVSVTPVEGSDYKYQFLATRVVPDGYKVEKVGFIYGKNLEDDELDLAKANTTSAAGTKIKVGYNNVTSVLETSLQYGLTGKTGTIKAKAFMIVSKDGKQEIITSGIKGYNYQGGFIGVIDDDDE